MSEDTAKTKYCPNCFAWMKPDNQACPECNFPQDGKPNQLYLLPQVSLRKQYLIGRVLGHGGFAVTYLGFDRNLGIKVAIKEYFPREFATRGGETNASITANPDQDSQKFYNYGLKRFVEEARLLSQLRHSNIIKVLNLFEVNSTAYYVMEYLDGKTLKDLVKEKGKLTFDEAYTILEHLMSAVDFLHSRKCFHRDIKPANIYLTSENTPILLDFGSARNQLASQSRSLNAMLTPGYAPIEQYSVKGRQGPWTDIYALAATMYYLLTGRVPPETPDLSQDLETLKPPSEENDAISPSQEKWLMKGLALRPEERPQSITEWQQQAIFNDTTSESQANDEEPKNPQSHLLFIGVGLGAIILVLMLMYGLR